MQVKAHLSNARMSPRKVRQLTPVIVNHQVDDALFQLAFQPGKAAAIVHKLLRSALANAKNNLAIESGNLKVISLIVGEGMKFKRFEPVSRGSAHPYVKRNSHVTVVLEEIKPSDTIRRKKETDIQTLSMAELSTIPHEPVAEEVSEKTPNVKTVEGVHTDPKLEAYQKIKMMQKGGDPKKTHRRKSM